MSGMGIGWSQTIKECIARNPKCPKRILDELADRSDIDLKVLVASNPNISKVTRDKLNKYKSVKVARAIKSNKGY
jgi:hypothetical protein